MSIFYEIEFAKYILPYLFLSFIFLPSNSGKIPKLAFIGWNFLFGVDMYFANAPITVFSEKIIFSTDRKAHGMGLKAI